MKCLIIIIVIIIIYGPSRPGLSDGVMTNCGRNSEMLQDTVALKHCAVQFMRLTLIPNGRS